MASKEVRNTLEGRSFKNANLKKSFVDIFFSSCGCGPSHPRVWKGGCYALVGLSRIRFPSSSSRVKLAKLLLKPVAPSRHVTSIHAKRVGLKWTCQRHWSVGDPLPIGRQGSAANALGIPAPMVQGAASAPGVRISHSRNFHLKSVHS